MRSSHAVTGLVSRNAAAAAQMITIAHPRVAATVGTRRSAMVGSPGRRRREETLRMPIMSGPVTRSAWAPMAAADGNPKARAAGTSAR